jgi:hypothetical protein
MSNNPFNNRPNLLTLINEFFIDLEILGSAERFSYGSFTAFAHKSSKRADQEARENIDGPRVGEDAEDLE